MRTEIRTCIHCGESKEIEQRHKHSNNICRECRNEKAKAYNTKKALLNGRRQGTTGRRPYPLEEGFTIASLKFRSLARKMFKIETREEWRVIMKANLDKTFANEELMNWINGHNEDDTPKKKPKKQPDTRSMTWEEYEAGGWGEDIDS